MSGYTFPTADYNEDNSALLCVPIAVIPFFRRLFELMQRRESWFNREHWWNGYQVAAYMEEMLMGGCVTDLITEQKRLYRLLDAALNGQEYTASTDDFGVTTVEPTIPDVPALPAGITAGLRRQLLDMQGVINAGWFGIGGQPATLADLVNALRVGSADSKQSLLDTLASILGAAGSATDIFSFVEDLLADTIDASGEGAILGVLIAATMAQTATSGAQAAQLDTLISKLDRLISSLDGGAGSAPTTNVISELQATNTLLG